MIKPIVSSEATCGGTWSGFDQLYPTNHIHFGYVDRMAWKNMVHFTGSLNLRPTPNSHLDISGHKFYLNNELDNWYGANQNIFFKHQLGIQKMTLEVKLMWFIPSFSLLAIIYPGRLVEVSSSQVITLILGFRVMPIIIPGAIPNSGSTGKLFVNHGVALKSLLR